MPRRILAPGEELNDFYAWLKKTGKSASTCRSYVSAVRVTLREVDGREGEKDFMDAYWGSPEIRDAPNRACAWRKYVKFFNETHGTDLPSVPRKGGKKKPLEDLPEEVCEAIRMLRDANFAYKEIMCLAWSDVDLEEFIQAEVERIHVRKPFDRSVMSLVPREAIESLFNWCGESSRTHSPLIPREPGSDEPYSIRGLQKQAQKGQPTLLEKAKMLREKSLETNPRPRTLAEARNSHEQKLRDEPLSAQFPSKFIKPVPSGATAESLLGLAKETPRATPQPPAAVDMVAEMLKRGVDPEVVARFVQSLPSTLPSVASEVEPGEPMVGPDGLLIDPNDPDTWENQT